MKKNKTNKRPLRLISLTLIMATTLFGCASKPATNYQSIALGEDDNKSDPASLYERTAALFSRPENIGLDFYSPTYYQSAIQALEDAEAALKDDKNKAISPIRASIAAKKLLEKAQENRAKVDRNLKELIKHRNLLIELEANKWAPEGWNKVSAEIRGLITNIESGEIKAAITEEPNVRENMYALEINTLLASALDAARRTLADARVAEAQTYAPFYYNNADILISDTEVFIRSNYRNRKEIANRAEQARLEAARAQQTAIDARRIANFDEAELEAYLREIKAALNKIVLRFQDEELQPSTVNNALDMLSTIAEQHKITKPAEPEPSQADYQEPETAQQDELQVIEVLDSLYLNQDTSDDQAEPFEGLGTEVEAENTDLSFDDVEFVE